MLRSGSECLSYYGVLGVQLCMASTKRVHKSGHVRHVLLHCMSLGQSMPYKYTCQHRLRAHTHKVRTRLPCRTLRTSLNCSAAKAASLI